MRNSTSRYSLHHNNMLPAREADADDEQDEETTQLLGKTKEKSTLINFDNDKSKYGSTEDSSPGSAEGGQWAYGPGSINKNTSATPERFSLYKCFGRTVQKPWFMTCAQYFDYIYKVLIANGAVACAAVLLIKITNSTTYLEIWDGFLPMAGWLLILAEVLLCVSYSLSDYLALRACLFAACVLFVLYGLFGGPGVMLDMVVFNTVMALLNLKHAVDILYEQRYVEFDPEHEQIYTNCFASYMRRTEYEKMVPLALKRRQHPDNMLMARGDPVTSLTVITGGQVEVINKRGKVVNKYKANEFLEAPEWVRANLNPERSRFRVYFRSCDRVTLVRWSPYSPITLIKPSQHIMPRETLAALLNSSDERLSTSLRAVLGIQTAKMWIRGVELTHSAPHNFAREGDGLNLSSSLPSDSLEGHDLENTSPLRPRRFVNDFRRIKNGGQRDREGRDRDRDKKGSGSGGEKGSKKSSSSQSSTGRSTPSSVNTSMAPPTSVPIPPSSSVPSSAAKNQIKSKNQQKVVRDIPPVQTERQIDLSFDTEGEREHAHTTNLNTRAEPLNDRSSEPEVVTTSQVQGETTERGKSDSVVSTPRSGRRGDREEGAYTPSSAQQKRRGSYTPFFL